MLGEEHVLFTLMFLIGINETQKERLKSLLLLQSLHQWRGHVQELVSQTSKQKRKPQWKMFQNLQVCMGLFTKMFWCLLMLNDVVYVSKLPTSSSLWFFIWCKLKNQWCLIKTFPQDVNKYYTSPFFEIINHDKLKFGNMGFPWFCKFGQVEGVEGKPIIGVMFFLS